MTFTLKMSFTNTTINFIYSNVSTFASTLFWKFIFYFYFSLFSLILKKCVMSNIFGLAGTQEKCAISPELLIIKTKPSSACYWNIIYSIFYNRLVDFLELLFVNYWPYLNYSFSSGWIGCSLGFFSLRVWFET